MADAPEITMANELRRAMTDYGPETPMQCLGVMDRVATELEALAAHRSRQQEGA